MLSQLFINNLAVIKEAEINLGEGLNVFTGETGAGKSVLIGAISSVLGGRVSKDLIRFGESKARITALFNNLDEEVLELLSDLGYDSDEGELLISREITQTGTNCRINGLPATVGILRQIGEHLVSIHGQHDNQVLFNTENHRKMIDDFAGLEDRLKEYSLLYNNYRKLSEKLEEYTTDIRSRNERIDLLSFQINELDEAKLEAGEEEALLARRSTISNVSKLTRILGSALEKLTGDDEGDGIDGLVSELQYDLEQLEEYMPQFSESRETVENFAYELREIVSNVRSAFDDLEYDPAELDEIENRLDLLYRLKRKYNRTIDELIAYYDEAVEELDSISFSEEKLEKLRTEHSVVYQKAVDDAGEISKLRKAAADKLSQELMTQLADLDMQSVSILADFGKRELSSTGIDKIEFLISTNKGEQPKPMAKIASGGELSRIMLAFKTITNKGEGIATAIFDEVDSGVSGRAAQKIGKKLQQVGAEQQIICVTHLSQVASFGDHHLLISKAIEDERTLTTILSLSDDQRTAEIARINSGENITELALSTAREMLDLHKRI